MIELLNHEDEDLLRNAICSIRSMGSIGQCQDELISDEVFSRVACIIETYPHDELLVRNSLAVLAVFSYNEESHPCLAVKDVMRVLFRLTDCKDIVARVLITTTLCNMSVTPKARSFMLERGLIDALGVLSGTTNEQIQELCATCLCNMAAAPALQKQLVSGGALELLMVIALARSTSTHTKQLCARALLNIFSTTDVIMSLQNCDALRIFAGLSAINHVPTQVICARGFLTLTGTEAWRRELIQLPVLLQAMLNMLNSQSEEARLMLGIAVCNLLVCPLTQSTLLSYNGLDILKALSVCNVDDMKEAIAETLFSLVNIPALQPILIRESVISMMLYYLQDANDKVFLASLNALYQMAKSPGFRAHMLESQCASVLVSLVIQGNRLDTSKETDQKIAKLFAERCSQILCLLSYAEVKCASLVEHSKVMVAFHIFYSKRLCTIKMGTYLAFMLRNLSTIIDLRASLVESKCVALLGNILIDMFQLGAAQEILQVRRCLLPLLLDVCREVALQPEVLRQGLMELITVILLNKTDIKELVTIDRKVSRVVLTATEILQIATTIQLVSQTVSCHITLLDSGCIRILHLLSSQININDDAKHEIACAICKLSATRNPVMKNVLTEQGASEILTPIAKTTPRPDTQKQCLLALGYLSNASRINSGAVSSLLHIAAGFGVGKDPLTGADTLQLASINEETATDLRTARLTQRTNSSDGSKRIGSAGSRFAHSFTPHNHSSGAARVSGRLGLLTESAQDKASEIVWTPIERAKHDYEIIYIPIETEMAGKANAVSFPNLSLPKATKRSKVETDERSAQLTVPPLPTAPIPKDMTEISLDTDFQAQRDDAEDNASEASDAFESQAGAGLQLDMSTVSSGGSGKKTRKSLLRRKKSSSGLPSFRLMASARSARTARSTMSGSSDKSMIDNRPGTKGTSRRSSIASRADTPVLLAPIYPRTGSVGSQGLGEDAKFNSKRAGLNRATSCFL